ncbi:site-specific DNA-methyltransferase [Seonamhaeicola sp.]|uniref:DNA-methyltransferase n=1 Tax=Seonamhaeicola sp. TaxID=1912245 RepID=UPI0035640A8A
MIHEIDVLEGFKMIPDKSQDLIIVDPPYYKAINEKWDNQWKNEQEYLEWCKLWFAECVRTLKDSGSFYCYGNFDILSKQKVLIFDNELTFRQNITLDKGLKSIAGRTSDKIRMFPTASEYLLFYINQSYSFQNNDSVNEVFKPIIKYLKTELKRSGLKTKDCRKLMGLKIDAGGLRYFSDTSWMMIPKKHYTSLQTSEAFTMPYEELSEWYNSLSFTFNLPMATTDVWNFTPDKVRYGHPTQKPQDICQRIIKASSNKNDNVLIPFAGSGSECVACDDLKRNWIAFENDKDNFSMSKKRVEKNKRKRLEEMNFDKALN